MSVWTATVILEVRQGEPLPAGYTFLQLIQTWDRPVGVGANTERVYVILAARP